MKNFIRLNLISFIYSISILVPIELTINVLRISRLTNLDIDTVSILSLLVVIFVFLVSSIGIVFVIRKWTEVPKWVHFSVILWFPYFILLVFIGTSLFPATNLEDIPSAGTGLLALGMLVAFPAYIIFTNHLAISKAQSK
ncbi:hypothetical protein [uncultured Planococcus sp.]|uniref:hypothetical protein n=1 Tax=uncultured Planococcus sp. TaxID=337815 RepID=UPI00261B6805|nr:hypothetical protein [uncultured Planococcus sp.]